MAKDSVTLVETAQILQLAAGYREDSWKTDGMGYGEYQLTCYQALEQACDEVGVTRVLLCYGA